MSFAQVDGHVRIRNPVRLGCGVEEPLRGFLDGSQTRWIRNLTSLLLRACHCVLEKLHWTTKLYRCEGLFMQQTFKWTIINFYFIWEIFPIFFTYSRGLRRVMMVLIVPEACELKDFRLVGFLSVVIAHLKNIECRAASAHTLAPCRKKIRDFTRIIINAWHYFTQFDITLGNAWLFTSLQFLLEPSRI